MPYDTSTHVHILFFTFMPAIQTIAFHLLLVPVGTMIALLCVVVLGRVEFLSTSSCTNETNIRVWPQTKHCGLALSVEDRVT